MVQRAEHKLRYFCLVQLIANQLSQKLQPTNKTAVVSLMPVSPDPDPAPPSFEGWGLGPGAAVRPTVSSAPSRLALP